MTFKNLCLLFTSLIAISASAAQASMVGIPSWRGGMIYAEQEYTQWCWAASIQMVLRHYGVNVSQKRIVRRSFGSYADGSLPNWPGSFELITANLNGWESDDSEQPYVVSAILCMDKIVIPELIVQQLGKGKPVILGYTTGTSGHAVVCTAAEYFVDQFGSSIITSITVRDPWIDGVGKKTYSGTDLGPRIQAAWMVTAELSE